MSTSKLFLYLLFKMAFIHILIFIVILFSLYQKRMSKYRNLPPGPFSLPLVGSIPFLKGKGGPVGWMVDESLYPYGKDFCTVWMGMIPFIWVQDFELTKELFAKEEFSDRMDEWYFRNIKGCYGRALGIGAESGLFWQEQRRFALKHLRGLGFGKQSLDTAVQGEAKDIVNTLIRKANMDLDKNVLIDDGFFNFAVVNVLWQIIATDKLDPYDVEKQQIVQKICQFNRKGHRMVDFVSIFRPFVPYDEGDRNVFTLKDTIRKQVFEHERLLNEGSEPRDFMDIYLKEIESEKKKYGSRYSHKVSDYHIEQLVGICLDFFGAGSETTSTTLSWGLMYMVLNHKVQRKCQKEIDDILGDSIPTKNDMHKLVYCVATIEEIQRLSCVAPGSLPHVLTKNMSINGFDFPKGSIFMANVTKFLKDPLVFPEPRKFQPERFLTFDEDGNIALKKIKQHIPFGIGKRICLGESFARMELFIFFVMMLQRLTFDLPVGHPKPNDNEYTHGFTKAPNPFYISISERNL